MIRDEIGRPPGNHPDDRPVTQKAPASADQPPSKGSVSAISVRRRRRSAPPMRVSLFEPTGRRTQWWFTGRCLRCGCTSFGRVKHEDDADAVRRVSCGHKVRIIVARVYRLSRQEAA